MVIRMNEKKLVLTSKQVLVNYLKAKALSHWRLFRIREIKKKKLKTLPLDKITEEGLKEDN